MTSEKVRDFFLLVLFISIPFSIAGDDFAVIGLYLVTFYRLATRQDRLRFTPIMVGMGVMIIGAFIGSLFSGEVLHSLTYFRNFWRLGLPFMVWLAFQNRSSDRFLRILAVTAGLIAVYGVVQYFTGLDVLRSAARQAEYKPSWGVWHAVGVFSHHLTFGGVFLLLFAMFMPNVLTRNRSRWERMLYFFIAVSCLAAAICSMGRSVWFGAIVALGVMFLVFLGRKRSMIAIVVVLLLAGGFYASQGTGKDSFFRSTYIGRRIMSISLKSNIDRIKMWTAATRAIRDNPVLGLGPNRRDLLDPYYERIRREDRHRFQHKAHVGVHNIYLQNWIDFGFLGMSGYLIWWGTLIVQILLNLRTGAVTGRLNAQLTGFLAGLAGIMVAGVFENNFRDGEVQTLILLVMGLALVMLDLKKQEQGQGEENPANETVSA